VICQARVASRMVRARAGGPDVTEILTRLADLQQRHDELARENAELRGQADAPISRDLAGGDELVEIDFTYTMADPIEHVMYKTKLSWNALFYGIAEDLITERPSDKIEQALIHTITAQIWQTPLFDEMTKRTKPKDYKEFLRRTLITDDSFKMVMLQFIALGVVEVSSMLQNSGYRLEQVWKLTRSGLRAYLEKNAQRKG
jgi:hypothetical protein